MYFSWFSLLPAEFSVLNDRGQEEFYHTAQWQSSGGKNFSFSGPQAPPDTSDGFEWSKGPFISGSKIHSLEARH